MQSMQSERSGSSNIASTKKYDFQKCKIHRTATNYGEPINNQIVCPCCDRKTNKKQISYNFSIQELFYLGPNLPQYFLTLKVVIIIIGISLCFFGIPMMIINYMSNDCSNITSLHCSNLFFVDFSLANSINSESKLLIQTILASIVMIFSSIIGFVGKFYIQRMKLQCKQKYCFQNDYSVFIRFENNVINQQVIQQSLESWWKNQKLTNLKNILGCFYPFYSNEKIEQLVKYQQSSSNHSKNNEIQSLLSFLNYPLMKKIIFCYNVQKFKEVKQKIFNLEEKVKQIQSLNSHRQLKDKQIQILKNLLQQLSTLKSQKYLSHYLQLTNKCILIFQFQPISKYFVLKFRNNSKCFKENIQGINFKTIEHAPTPKQINWENHHLLLDQHKFTPRLCSVSFFLLAMSIITCAIIGLLILWDYHLRNTSKIIQSIFSPLLALIIVILNYFGRKCISSINQYEKRPFKSEDFKSQFWRILFISFTTQGLVLGLAYSLIGVNELWAYNGFLDTIFYLFSIQLFLHPLVKFINFGVLIQKISHGMIQSYSNPQMTQKQANQAYENRQFQIVYSNFWMAHMLIWSCFISCLIPFSLIMCFISVLLEYFMQKVNLVKFCKQPVSVSDEFSKFVYKTIYLSPFFVGIGNLFCILIKMKYQQNFEKYFISFIINLSILVISFLAVVLINQNQILSLYKNLNLASQKGSKKALKTDLGLNQNNSIQSSRQPKIKLLLKNQKHQAVKTLTFQLQTSPQKLYHKSYDMVSSMFNQTYEKNYPIPIQYLLKSNSKQISVSYRQKMQIVEQLNTMSRSLESSLKDRLFSQQRKGAILTPQITHRQFQTIDENIYFQYQDRVSMQKPTLRVKIPPLYKKRQQAPGSSSLQYEIYKSKSSNLQTQSKRQNKISKISAVQQQGQSSELKRISSLFGDEQEQLKNIVKNKIRQSIKKINN